MRGHHWHPVRVLPLALATFAVALLNATPSRAREIWDISQDFSDVQGQDDWYYGYTQSGGPFALMTEVGVFLDRWTVDWLEPPPLYWTMIGRDYIHPNGLVTGGGRTPMEQEAVLRWVSPIADMVHLDGHVEKWNTGPSSNGVDWIIRHNNLAVFSQFLAGQDSVGFDYSIDLSVSQGDAIDFVLNSHESDDRQDGTTYSAVITRQSTGVGETRENAHVCPGTHLTSNYPNPFNPGTTIEYDLPPPGGRVNLSVYDVRGRLVRTLVDGNMEPGRQQAYWDGNDDARQAVSSGIYFYRLSTPQGVEQRMAVLLK